ncbi:MAG TPA: GtrA family protein [Terriglobales bacterium]|nr:GtrA family protein [Terriglobales bacterium]
MKPDPYQQPHRGDHIVTSPFTSGLLTLDEAVAVPSEQIPLGVQMFRFGVVGAINTAVDLIVLNLLIVITHTGQRGASFAVFKTIAFVCAVLNSYLMNRSWTFRGAKKKNSMLEGSQFMFVSVLGAVVNVGSSWYVATFTHPILGITSRWWPSLAALVGTAFSLGFNFIGYKFWVFAHRRH